MPVLAAQACVYPEDLLCDANALPLDRRWWAVRTKTRQEKSLARDLLSYEIPFYLPLVKQFSIKRGRRVCAHLPLFSGYVFLLADEVDRIRSLTTNRIAQLLPVPVPQQFAFHQNLLHLSRLIDSSAPITLEQRLEPGQRVRIRSGLMRGVEGTLICRRGETRLLVAIDFLQQGASLEIHDFQIEPVEN